MSQEKIESVLGQARKSQVEKQALLKSVAEIGNLPTPSPSVMKAMLLLRNDDVKLDLLVQTVERDQSLVAQILKLVNSGFYGLRKAVDSVERGITLIGLANVKRMIYSASIMDFFSEDEQIEWSHSHSSSILLTKLISENEFPGLTTLPLSMIMHDIGKVVLRRFSPKKYNFAFQNAMAHKLPIYKVEEAILQLNHAEVGAMLLSKWDIAEEIVKPVLYHHCEGVPESFVAETALLQFANWVDCQVRGIPVCQPSAELLDAAGLTELDSDYWMNYQSKLINSLEFSVLAKSDAARRQPAPAPEPIQAPRHLIDESARPDIGKPNLPPLTIRETLLIRNEESSRLLKKPIGSTKIEELGLAAESATSYSAVPEKISTSTQVIRRGAIVRS